jgi:hypothetical protein
MWGGILTATNLSSAVAAHCAVIGDPESPVGPIRSRLTLCLLLILVASCASDLAPREQPPCDSRGTLVPGTTREGYLGEANCPIQSDVSPGLPTNRDRWTLQLHPDTVYVVSARYLVPAGGARWSGRLLGYAVAGGDTLLRTGYWGTSGTANGELLHEMLLASTTDRALIVHLERATATDSGRYQLDVRRCPVLHLDPGTTSLTIALDGSCLLWTAGAPGRARFFDYPSDSAVVRDITVTPNDPAVSIYYAWASRPPLNFACWYAAGSCDLGTGGTTIFTVRPFPVDGITAGVLFTLGASTSVTVGVAAVP